MKKKSISLSLNLLIWVVQGWLHISIICFVWKYWPSLFLFPPAQWQTESLSHQLCGRWGPCLFFTERQQHHRWEDEGERPVSRDLRERARGDCALKAICLLIWAWWEAAWTVKKLSALFSLFFLREKQKKKKKNVRLYFIFYLEVDFLLDEEKKWH